MAINIDDRLIEELEDQYDSEDTFEEIPRAAPNKHQDSKKISDKSERKKAKEQRRKAREGKWGRLQEMVGIDDQFAW